MTFSIAKWFGRLRGAGVLRPEDNRRRARILVDRGIAAEASGTRVESLKFYRMAVEADRSFAPAHLNLGIALQATEDWGAAIASYEQAISIDPGYSAAHYNLALAFLWRDQYSEAEAAFRSALRCRDDFPEAWVGLASALETLGRDEDALLALEHAITLRSEYPGALNNSSALLHKMGRFEAALARDRSLLEMEPENCIALFRLAIGLYKLGRLAEAEARFREVLTFQPDHLEAKTLLAMSLVGRGRATDAIPVLFDAVASAPGNAQLRTILVDALFGVAFTRASEKERNILLSLCMDDNVSMLFLDAAIIGLTKSGDGFRILRESTDRGGDPFTTIDPVVAAFLREPLLLAALPRMTFWDAGLETVLTHLRRCILLRFRKLGSLTGADPVVPAEFVCAMARQCFLAGYAYLADEDELRHVSDLRDALASALQERTSDPRTLERALAVSSLYASLDTQQGCGRLRAIPSPEWSESFRPIVTEQIENPMRERDIAARIPSVTDIDNVVSLAVRAQYEENPYPRWVTVPSPGTDTMENLSQRLRPGRAAPIRSRPAQILVAGCGTGHHPIQVARAFPSCEILAVDLSLASLAYASRMTERLGITNITYRQADILKLGTLEQRFAVIECCGVLHHLDEPIAGWQALLDVLEPEGLMKIAVYSEIARGGIRAAREFIRPLELPRNPEGIRQCRDAIMRLPEGHPARDVMTFRDFFELDGCRDLLMHVQEHQFTFPRIAECLDQLKLQFLQLECRAATRVLFTEAFPDDEAGTRLAAWHQFETARPETFKSMYTFWCCRKLG